MNYKSLTDEEKEKVLRDLYFCENLSWIEVGKRLGISVDIAKRNARKFGIKSRSTSQAAKLSMDVGRSISPMKGKKQPEERRRRIAKTAYEYWQNRSPEEMEKKRKLGKKQWDEKPIEEKLEIIRKTKEGGIRSLSVGSKLETFIVKELASLGYRTDHHKTHLIRNTRMHIDIFIRSLRTIIEIDGPSHFKPIRGEENLLKTQARDRQKTGLILAEGFCLIRVRHFGKMSKHRMIVCFNKVNKILEDIKNKFPDEGSRLFFV